MADDLALQIGLARRALARVELLDQGVEGRIESEQGPQFSPLRTAGYRGCRALGGPVPGHAVESERGVDLLVGQPGRVAGSGEEPGDRAYLLALVALLVEGLGDISAFGKALTVDPVDRVADLEPGVLDRDREPVEGARRAEGEQVPAGLEHPAARAPDGRVERDARGVPGPAEQADLIGRVGDHRVDAVLGQLREHLAAIAHIQPGGVIATELNAHETSLRGRCLIRRRGAASRGLTPSAGLERRPVEPEVG